ncbi:hypothetical protein MHLP_03305 [Candidatus Mycoplasma haematolamae str. Purdue]|uniref:Uncharacterized protein n=1 Tax=Mycoplasma haematolamae (strain Purdue) TaxID=1212765 RepID=I7CG65_MYCHA|nr:hypothetical protein [Candidatus Mycoplasma haematolamae]AFO52241.1 hypothetical protein MHLP_03305 [Candidatus Mycoplasma haematolamae str. Purdue]
MFPFSRLVGSSLGFLAVGSTGVAVTPFSLSDPSFWDLMYSEGNRKKGDYDFESLRLKEQELKQKLEEIGKTLSSGLEAASSLKERQLSNIKKGFELIEKHESSLKNKYEEFRHKIDLMTKWVQRESGIASKKMQTQQTLELIKLYEKALKKINEKFYEWDKTIHEIVCVIKKGEQADSNCLEESKYTPFENMIASIKGNAQSVPPPAPRAKRAVQGQEELASDAAKAELAKVQRELENLSQQLEFTWRKSLASKGRLVSEARKFSRYEAFMDYAKAYIDVQKLLLKRKIAQDTKEAESLVKKINGITEVIVQSNQVIEKLKIQYTDWKAYENQITTSLCSLHTISIERCSNSEASYDDL